MDLGAIAAIIPPQYLVYVMAASGVCAALDAWLPVMPAGSAWSPLRRVISLVGQNYRNASNVKPAS